MLVKEKDVEKHYVILLVMLYLVVRAHYCFMLGTITALCRLATAYYCDVYYLIISNEIFLKYLLWYTLYFFYKL